MDQNRFDAVTRTISSLPSRRDLLRGLAGAGLGLGIARLPELVEAKKKRKKRKKVKKPQPNQFGCLEVGDACSSEADCCSGICEGTRKKTCQSHGTGTCPQDRAGICLSTADDVPFLKCNNGGACFCYTTTAGSSFCGDRGPVLGDAASCADCQTDADCDALGFPEGSACAPVGTGYCAGECASGMACLAPCGTELPPLRS